MPNIKFGSPCFCDCPHCYIYQDKFDRANIGSDWTIDTGTWSISSDRLTTSSSDAFIEYDPALNNPNFGGYVAVGMSLVCRIKATNSGDIAGFQIHTIYNADVIFEIEFGAAAMLRVWKNAVLLIECECVAPVNTWIDFRCDFLYQSDEFVAVMIGDELIAKRWVQDAQVGGIYSETGAGPYTGTITGPVYWDDFTVWENDTWGYPTASVCKLDVSPCLWPLEKTVAEMPAGITVVIREVGFDGTFDRAPLNGTWELLRVGSTCEYNAVIEQNLLGQDERFYYSRLNFIYDIHFGRFRFHATFSDSQNIFNFSSDTWLVPHTAYICGNGDLFADATVHYPYPPNPGTVTFTPGIAAPPTEEVFEYSDGTKFVFSEASYLI